MGLFGRKKAKTGGGGAELLAKIDGRLVRYVTRRGVDENGSPTETVLGKEGRIMTQNGRIVVMSGGREVFRCAAEEASCGELMSLEGVVFTGPNELSGKRESVVAYYKYYR
mgnify:CR=1 FL=1|jgi:hypothetical protein